MYRSTSCELKTINFRKFHELILSGTSPSDFPLRIIFFLYSVYAELKLFSKTESLFTKCLPNVREVIC